MITEIDLGFCQSFQYPRQLTDILSEVVRIARREPIESLLLVGSTARGEVSILASSDTLDLWSDVEFFIIPQSGQVVNKESLRAAYEDLCSKLNIKSPFFHIDFAVVPSSRLSRFPQRISVFEAKSNGRVLWGRDIRGKLPKVTLDSLDYGNTKHLVLIRLTEMLIHIPQRIVAQCASPFEEMVFGYVQVRNALDILTILLPHEGALLPSYRARNNHLRTNYSKMESRPYMGTDFPDFLSDCLRSKLTLEFSTSPGQLYQRVLKGYFDLLRFFMELDPQKTLTALELSRAIERSNLHLGDQKFFTRQRLGEWKLLAGRLVSRKPIVSAALHRKRLISILVLMHEALLRRLWGQEDAMLLLAEARRRLRSVSLRPMPPVSAIFAQEWLGLRQAYVDAFTTFYVSKRAQRSYYQELLEGRYD